MTSVRHSACICGEQVNELCQTSLDYVVTRNLELCVSVRRCLLEAVFSSWAGTGSCYLDQPGQQETSSSLLREHFFPADWAVESSGNPVETAIDVEKVAVAARKLYQLGSRFEFLKTDRTGVSLH